MEKILKYIVWIGLSCICFVPLIVKGTYYFPYIVPKTLIFKIIINIIFLAFLGLAVIKKEYRPKINLVLILFFLYIIVVSFSSFLAGDFYFSFWSNNERSEGLLLLFYLFVFLIVLSGFFKRIKDWFILFEASFLSSILVSLVALGQYLDFGRYFPIKWQWLFESSGGTRLASTVGNAGYVAGYLIFNIFFGLILFLFRKNKYLRSYYILGIFFQIFIVLNTLTRGSILALGFTLAAFVGYLIFSNIGKSKIVIGSGIIILLIGIIFTGFVFSNKEADWVKKNPILSRVSSISIEAATAQTRLMTWNSAWQGFKEKPILGYGYENFYQVFDKYFNPKIYKKAGSVVWFDRAHNMIFDRLITGGLIGLSLYLGLLLIPLYYLWKYFWKNKTENKYLIPVIFTLVMLAYLIQNFFIFEALVTYIPLFIVLAFLSQFCPSFGEKYFQSKEPYLILLTIGIVVFLPIMFIFSIKPAIANKDLVSGLIKDREAQVYENPEIYNLAYDNFINAIERNTSGNQEYRQQLSQFVVGLVDNEDVDIELIKQAVIRTKQELDKQIEEKPKNARNYLIYMRFLNKTYNLNIEYLNKSLELGEKAVELSPTRPHTYNEIAYTQVYLGKYYESIGSTEKANQVFNEAVINTEKALALNDSVMESYINVIMILFTADQNDKVQIYLDKMDEIGINYHTEASLGRMINSAIYAEDYNYASRFNKELTEIVPNKPDYWLNLALSYAYLGEKEKAVETAEKIKEFGEDYIEQSDLFIQDVLAGKFD